MTARDRRRGASWRNLRHDLCLQKSIYQVSRQVGTQGKSPWVWASAPWRRRLSAWALLEEGGGNNQNICNNYMLETVRTSILASLDLGWRATSVTPAVSVGLCPCLKGGLSPQAGQNWLNARKPKNSLIRKFCSVKSHKTIQKVMHHQQHADLKSEICKQRNSNRIIPQKPQNLSTMILAPAPSNSNLNSQKQRLGRSDAFTKTVFNILIIWFTNYRK